MIFERIRFMKVNRHKRFNFTPRFYDERKERIKKLKEAYNGNSSSKEQQLLLRERIQSSWRGDKSYSKKTKAANLRLIIILAILVLIAYLILGNVNIFTSKVIDISNP